MGCCHVKNQCLVIRLPKEIMDSSGIGLVLGRVRKIHPINGKVYLFGGNELIQKMWEMAGILNLVTVLDSIEKVKEVYE